jgi:hypothetical protein
MSQQPSAGEPAPRGDLGKDALEVFDEVTGIDRIFALPVLLVGGAAGIALFIVAAIVFAIPYWLAVTVLQPTGTLAAVLGFSWLGASLGATAYLLRRFLRAFNGWLRRRGLPTLY